MGVELWTNNAKSTLASGISPSDVSLTVATGEGALFPTISGSDYFYVTLDDGAEIEIVKCTSRSTDTLTIVRAQQGTSGTAFFTGAKVENRLTKQSMADLQPTNNITTAAYGARPEAAQPGRIFLPDNGFVLERDTGSAWQSWGPIFQFTTPVDGDFSWINPGSTTVRSSNGGFHLSAPSNGGVQGVRMRVKTLPAPPYTLDCAFLPMFYYQQYSQVSFGLRESSSGKFINFQVFNEGGNVHFNYTNWANPTTLNAIYINTLIATAMPFPLVIIRFQDDGANRKLLWSHDLKNFIQINSVSRTDYCTPDQGFIGLNPFSQITGVTVLHWKEESIPPLLGARQTDWPNPSRWRREYRQPLDLKAALQSSRTALILGA